jgi:hypothetical protein
MPPAAPDGAPPRRPKTLNSVHSLAPSEAPTRRPSDPHQGVGSLVIPHSKIPTLFPPNPGPIQPRFPHFQITKPASTGNCVHAHKKVQYNRVFSKNTRFMSSKILQNSGLLLAAKKRHDGLPAHTPDRPLEGLYGSFSGKPRFAVFKRSGHGRVIPTIPVAPGKDQAGSLPPPGKIPDSDLPVADYH